MPPAPTPQATGVRFTRRQVMAASAASVAALYVAGVPGSAAASGPAPARLTRAAWAPTVGRRLTLRAADGTTIPATLTAVTDVAGARTAEALRGSDDAFVLLLDGPESPRVAQGVHAIVHPQLGAVELFLVPISPPGGPQRYEVVVDRSVRLAGVEVPTAPGSPPAAPAPAPTQAELDALLHEQLLADAPPAAQAQVRRLAAKAKAKAKARPKARRARPKARRRRPARTKRTTPRRRTSR